ncbi:MAG: hypothetical protein MZV70_14765 [Desulfobacterales bacterium]|nr:hypothetical protein [Desulfobacterales bacterium]
MKRRSYCFIFLLCIFFGPGLAAIVQAAEPVEIVVEGVEGDARKNVLEALALPYGLVKDGKVDRLWLERFVRQADQMVVAALEPFGYYSARVTIHIETPKADQYRLRVKVEVRSAGDFSDVSVSVTGSGASESSLMALAAAFPLHTGDVPLHQSYEQARRGLQASAQELGYLDAEYTIHEMRIDPAVNSACITLVLETGQRYYFHSVTIEGASDYPDAFLRHYIYLSER